MDAIIVCPLKLFVAMYQKVFWEGGSTEGTVMCKLTALFNGASITTTAPVLLFLCIERAFLVLAPVRGKIWLDSVGAKIFFALNLGNVFAVEERETVAYPNRPNVYILRESCKI